MEAMSLFHRGQTKMTTSGRRFSSGSARHDSDDKDAAAVAVGPEHLPPGNDSSPAGQGCHCSVCTTAEPQSQRQSRGHVCPTAKGPLPEAQSEVGIG